MGLKRSLVLAWLVCLPAIATAQTVEIGPVGGYRFGGGFFERVTQQEIDLDGAPSVGLVVNVLLRDGLFVEALVTHQEAGFTVPPSAFGPATRWRIAVDHYQADPAGVLQPPSHAALPHRAPRADPLRGRRGQ